MTVNGCCMFVHKKRNADEMNGAMKFGCSKSLEFIKTKEDSTQNNFNKQIFRENEARCDFNKYLASLSRLLFVCFDKNSENDHVLLILLKTANDQ